MLFNVMKPGEEDTKDEEDDKTFMKQLSGGDKKLTKESILFIIVFYLFL